MDEDLTLSVFRQLDRLIGKMKNETERRQEILESIPGEYRLSATNLIHYLTLRNEDIRDLGNPGFGNTQQIRGSHPIRDNRCFPCCPGGMCHGQ